MDIVNCIAFVAGFESVAASWPAMNDLLVTMISILVMIGMGGFSLIWGCLLAPEINTDNMRREFDSYDASGWLWAGGEEWEEVEVVPKRWDGMESSVLTAWVKEPVAKQTYSYIRAGQVKYPFSNTTLDEMLM